MFYEYFVQIESEQGEQLYARCPFHNDTNASLTINKETEEWHCFGCTMGGTPVEFMIHFFGVSKKVALKAHQQYERKGSLPFPDPDVIEYWHKDLLSRPNEMAQLHAMGISEEVIRNFKIGFNNSDVRITIPIKTTTDEYCNVRKYLPPHRRTGGSTMKVINIANCGEARLFPLYDIGPSDKDVIIVEGEKDMLVGRSLGLNTITGTSGTAVPKSDLVYLKGRRVYIMTDSDTAGDKLASDYAKSLRTITEDVKRIRLPLKDLSDMYQEHGDKTVDLMWTFVVMDDEELIEDAEPVLLTHSEDVQKLNSWVSLKNMSVTGTDTKIYTIPKTMAAKCSNENCQQPCTAHPSMGGRQIPIEATPRDMVLFIDSSDKTQDRFLQEFFGCKYVKAETIESINAQKIMFQETAAFMEGMDESSTDNRYGIYLFDESRLAPTHRYNFEACRVADPRNQQNYYVIREALPVSSVQISEDSLGEAINYFSSVAASANSFQDILEKHYNTWMPKLNIEGRVDLFGALILTYLSVTEIYWRGGYLKGWLDTMVIGDTRTGKSQMAQRFTKALGMGSYINGENARATGVIGGVQRMGDSWIITWGAIPMNDRGLLVVDEASGLSIDDIKDLSATRSSGAVTINKIAKGEARARTRLIWLSNPRSGRNLEEFYWRGFGAFTEFIPVAEDQARYDIVLTAAREDVEELSGYKDTGESPPIELWQTLVTFAWNLPSTAIRYTDEVAQYIAEGARNLGKKYGGGPLVVEVAVHEKLIRLACAISILRGNLNSARALEVDNTSVDYAIEFLESTFNKPSLDYANYIKEYKRANSKRSENIKYVKGLAETHPAIKILLSSNIFRGNQVREVLGVSSEESNSIISNLLQKGLLKLTGSGAYAPDKLLIEITKQMNGGE